MRKIIAILLCLSVCFAAAACSSVTTAKDNAITPTNMAPLDTHQYILFMNRQIATATNQLSSQMAMSREVSADTLGIFKEAAARSHEILDQTLGDVKQMPPPEKYASHHESVVELLELCIEHVADYETMLAVHTDGTDYSSIAALLRADFVALTAESTAYWQ